jgi:hypothetical protein
MRHLPNQLKPSDLNAVLNAIGLSPGESALSADGLAFLASAKRHTVAEVDKVLGKTDLSIGDRIAVKASMDHAGLLIGGNTKISRSADRSLVLGR